MDAFQRGGNAVDAAIAANAVLAVAYPHMCGIGGDFFAIVADRSTRVAVNGSGAAALAVNADELRRRYRTMPAYGPLSVSVPGTIAAWGALLDRFGRRSLREAIVPAVAAAEDGLPIAPSLARAIATHRERIGGSEFLANLLIPNGHPLAEGQELRQPALAQTLRLIADEGASSFYQGRVASDLIAGLRRLGSPLTGEDFARHRTEFVDPIAREYRGATVLVPPPNSQGFVLQEILGCIDRGGIDPDHLASAAPVMARLFLLASADRDRLNADPRRAPVPVPELLDDRHLADLLDKARTADVPGINRRGASGDTVGIVAAEEGGLWVSINQSLYDAFGSTVLEPSTGVLLQNRGSGFSLDPSSPNVLEGGRRPAHTLMPVMVLSSQGPSIASATMGRNAHAQIHAQLLMSLLDKVRSAFDTIDRPRWLAGGLRADAGVVIESRAPASVFAAFAAAGIATDPVGARDEQVGHAQLIVRTAGPRLEAASDPRADGAALAT